MNDLVADGNTVVLVDHETHILKKADYMIEMGPGAGAGGGRVIAEGTIPEMEKNPDSVIGPYLSGERNVLVRRPAQAGEMFSLGEIRLTTREIHTVKPLHAIFPKGRLSVVTGVSGSGKTTLILESLIPGLQAVIEGKKLPPHVTTLTADGIRQVKLIDSTPIGINVRSTVATYSNVHDELRRVFAKTAEAKEHGFKAGSFSYNTGSLRCPECDGTGTISLDVQFLPDVEITCPACHGTRYGKKAESVHWISGEGIPYTLPEIMGMSVDQAIGACKDLTLASRRLNVLRKLGLGYLTLGEETPGLSGGEAQRLKLASEMGRPQSDSLFVFDEPTIGLHPLDVRTLLQVFETLLSHGATVIVIEHDRDVIHNADYIVDMGPGGGEEGGKIVASGTIEEIRNCPESITGRYL